MAIAAGVVEGALTVGIVRTVTQDQPEQPAAAAPFGTPGPPRLAAPSASPNPPMPADAGPVSEGADDTEASTGTGSDAGPAGEGATAADRRYWEPVAAGFGRAFT